MERTVQKVKFPPMPPKLKRVAAYARVSSGKDATLHSLAAQVEYYSNFIRRHPGWEYVGVYADEAKTGPRTAGSSSNNCSLTVSREKSTTSSPSPFPGWHGTP